MTVKHQTNKRIVSRQQRRSWYMTISRVHMCWCRRHRGVRATRGVFRVVVSLNSMNRGIKVWCTNDGNHTTFKRRLTNETMISSRGQLRWELYIAYRDHVCSFVFWRLLRSEKRVKPESDETADCMTSSSRFRFRSLITWLTRYQFRAVYRTNVLFTRAKMENMQCLLLQKTVRGEYLTSGDIRLFI